MPPKKKKPARKRPARKPAPPPPKPSRALSRVAVTAGGIAAAGLVLKGLRDAGYLEQWSSGDTPMYDADGPDRPSASLAAASSVAPMARSVLNPMFGKDLSGDAVDAVLAMLSGGGAPAVYAPAINGTMLPVAPAAPAFVPAPIVRKRAVDEDSDDDDYTGKMSRYEDEDEAYDEDEVEMDNDE